MKERCTLLGGRIILNQDPNGDNHKNNTTAKRE